MVCSRTLTAVLVAAIVLWGAACSKGDKGGRGSSTRTDTSTEAAPKLAKAHPALRCSECHEKMHREWTGSAHSQAASSAFFRAMRGEDASCDRCHAPLRGKVTPAATGEEGVTCELCHSISEVRVDRAGGGFTPRLKENVKFGPLCDAKNHYFHRMGCSPLHAEAEICAGCHLLYAGTLPVFTEYEEWKDSQQAAEGRVCQDCHMPGERAEVATGTPARSGVPHHGLLGKTGDLRKRALVGQASIARDGEGGLTVAVTLTNRGAGHSVPTGLPGRELVLRASLKDAGGKVLSSQETSLARRVVDAQGHEVPFTRGVRVASDDRLRNKETRTETLIVPGPAEGRVDVQVSWRASSPALAKALGLPPPGEQVLLQGAIAAPRGVSPAKVTLHAPRETSR